MGCRKLTYRPDFEVLKGGFAKRLTPEKSVLNARRCSYYILDAQGNQLSTYEHIVEDEESNYRLSERVIYGSSRLGMNTTKVDMLDDEPQEYISLELGNKIYEMSNHLGNVLTVINDIKIPVSSNSVDVDGYLATIVSTADYSPFGVQLDGRTVSASSYRFGYQGSEKDDEVKGEGNSYTTEFRMLDPRLGRWFSIDPKMSAWESPYVSMENSPIYINDPLGDTVKHANVFDKISTTVARIFNKEFREKYKELDMSPDVYTFDRDKKSKHNLIYAPSVETDCKTNENGVSYSENVINYNKGLTIDKISNPIVRGGAHFMMNVGKLAIGIPSFAIAIPFGLFTGIWNAFAKPENELGWGYYLRIETQGGVNLLNIGLGDYKNYNMLWMKREKTGNYWDKSQMHPDNALVAFRWGLGKGRPTQMFEIGQGMALRNWNYTYHLIINVRKQKYRTHKYWIAGRTEGLGSTGVTSKGR